jgi:uncharacterized protein
MTEKPGFVHIMRGNRAGLWLTLGGLALIFVCWQGALTLLGLYLADVVAVFGIAPGFESAAQEAVTMAAFLVIGFGPGFLIILAWRKLIERRPLMTLLTGQARFRWSLMLISCGLMLSLGSVLTVLLDPQSSADIASRFAQFDAQDWAILALAYGVGIGVQAGFEEVFVRGWLLQHCVRFVPNVISSVIVTSCAFSLLHFGHAGWATYFVTLVFGLVFGWSVIRLNGLEAAIGAHIGNNLFAALLVGQMISGNPVTMDGAQLLLLSIYVLGFLAFVEFWARFLGKPVGD